MAKLKIATAKGFTKEEAFKSTGLNLDLKFDATLSHKKENIKGSADLQGFATDYAEKRVKSAVGIGFWVTVTPGVADSRERPYKVKNIATKGARTWKTVYHGVVGADSEGLGGVTVFTKDTLAEAEAAGKAHVTAEKVKVEILLGKEVTGSVIVDKETGVKTKGAPQNVAMVIDYTPSINTTEGEYIFFGYEAE